MNNNLPKISSPAIAITPLVELRLAVEADLPKLEWSGEFSHFRRVIRQTYREQKLGRRAMLVAIFNDYPIGQLYLSLREPQNLFHNHHHQGYLYAFRVMPPFRSLGVGTALVQTAEEMLRTMQFSSAVISVAQDNLRARQLYERLGYHYYSEDEGIWSYINAEGTRVHMHEPSWILTKDLT